MKKTFVILAVLMVLCGLFMCGKGVAHQYTNCGMIISIDDDGSIVVDDGNNYWSFYDEGDWQCGDVITLVFDDNGTSWVYDDMIIGVKTV